MFHFDENTETIDAYINCIRQVATLLGFQEPQILEVFKNTLPTKLYWVFFPIVDLRQAVETVKRILTKEKIDRQLAGQTSTTPFMNIRDGFNKKVTFNMTNSMEQKIDKLMVMVGKLVTEDRGQNKLFMLRVYQSNRGRAWLGVNLIREDIKADLGQTVHTEEIQDTVKFAEIELDTILAIEVVMGIIWEVISI